MVIVVVIVIKNDCHCSLDYCKFINFTLVKLQMVFPILSFEFILDRFILGVLFESRFIMHYNYDVLFKIGVAGHIMVTLL